MNGSDKFTLDPKNGTGDWLDFHIPLERVYERATEWKKAVAGVDRPWLCWNISPRWCVLQQRLVQAVGWTPIIGFDPRIGPPPVLPGSVLINFNESFDFPAMWMHFPMEFVFLWTERLAFWHSDLLCRLPLMEKLSKMFESLEDGQMAAVLDKGGRRNYLNFKSHRFWELCGCTTAGASENQFYNGTGWWRPLWLHPKCRVSAERRRRRPYQNDHGAGILYWKNNYRGPVIPIDLYVIKEGHCSEIMSKNYKNLPNHFTALRDLPSELDLNYDIEEVAQRLGIAHLL
jgi:hypothetical protein